MLMSMFRPMSERDEGVLLLLLANSFIKAHTLALYRRQPWLFASYIPIVLAQLEHSSIGFAEGEVEVKEDDGLLLLFN
jgi:hypothetical protein